MIQALLLLDTNVVLYYLGNRLTDPLPIGKYFVSIITEMELLSYPNMSDSEDIIVRDFLTKITVLGLDNNIKELAIAFRKNYRLKLPDAIVAATAKSLNANLLTNDLKLRSIVISIKDETVTSALNVGAIRESPLHLVSFLFEMTI